MKKKMKALFPLLLVVVFIVSLAACSGGSDSGGKSGDAPAADTGTENTQAANTEETKTEPANDAGGEKVTITFAWWGDAKRHEKYNAIADLYEKENPYVKIERQYGSFNDYWDKLATQTAGGNAPDVQGMHATYVADYAQRGALLDLEPYLADGTIDIGSFPDSVKEVQKVEGKTVMIAQGVTMTGWNYNKGALDKLGVAAPDYNWTWDDFLAKVAEIQKAINASDNKKRWASVDASGDITGVQVYARQKGTDLFTAEGKLGVTKEQMTEWFAMWDKLRKDKVIPDAATSEQYATVSLDQGMLVKGLVILATFPFNQIPLYQNYIADGEVQPLRRPLDPSGKEGEFVEGAYLAVAKTSKYPKEAADFISFFVNNEEVQKIFKLEQGALGSTKGNEVIRPTLNPAEQRTLEAIETSLKTAGKLPLPPKGQGEVRTLLTETSQAVAFGQLSPEQGAQEFVEKAAEILAKSS
ncbi:MAG TPA: extracellular solute-binding protein [Paenibacillus sp.]|uniref:ABC transporter substrate-binding protein n=1 Tax=Paenibacillus sp. TaxID=58172 RepID=UPI0028D69D6A|nr:extracellular solute-binding protein [Paenibacillus sp.]HUC90460.1 extracellular solute-binding protein [Paenibacillus sp.]